MSKNKLDHLYQGGVLNFAHRGASHDAPENTLAAFRLALEMGADGVELDVQASRDGEAVVIHDFTVDATTDGQGAVKDKTLAELKELDAGCWFDATPTKRCPEPVEGLAFTGQRVPTLQEVIIVLGHQLLLNIELKARMFGSADLALRQSSGLVAEVVRLIEDHNLVHRVIVSSFNPFALHRVKRLNPHVSTGLLYLFDLPANPVRALLVAPADPDALHPQKRLVNQKYMDWAKERGYRVNTWTVDAPGEMKRLIALGVDGIITNRPDVLREILENREDHVKR
jgi:glycerophosphoryl diester phosphodiesterase